MNPSSEVLAAHIARQSDRLWSHVPDDLTPADNAETKFMLSEPTTNGDLMVFHPEAGRLFLLKDDVAWVYSVGEENIEGLSAYKDREPLGSTLVFPTLEEPA